jgi:hypothetical protein
MQNPTAARLAPTRERRHGRGRKEEARLIFLL